jgi:Ca-activated chloride channel family protein
VVVIGTVRDAATRSGVAQAQVFRPNAAPGNSTTTRADGQYTLTLTNVTTDAAITLQVRRIGYTAQTFVVHPVADTVRADIQLVAAVLRLSMATVAAPQFEMGRARGIATTTPSSANAIKSTPETVRFARDAADAGVNREQYDRIEDNPFLAVKDNALSTFSIDVDRASYGNMRRFLNEGRVPPADAVRIEELVNYFPYALETPRGKDPIAITTEVAPAPWQPSHQLVRIALQARRIDVKNLPPNNLVFLIDVSGSMSSADKLPLVKESLRLLVHQMREQDRVALVVYAGSAGLVLPSTSGTEKSRIMQAIDRLESGGSTAGGAGLELAYRTAREHFLRDGNNRVILASDGDFNVGPSSDAEMQRLIESRRQEGTYLTVLGFGTGNLQDAKMEKLAKAGNGNYAYVDNINEARKTLIREMGATLVTVANDVKLQVEFNPSAVRAYRLIGYENRLLRDEDFTDDGKDAGDIGSGHTVTALYEVVPHGVKTSANIRESEGSRYVTTSTRLATPAGSELLFVKLRYKKPGAAASELMTHPVRLASAGQRTSDDFRFAASVASFGMLLRGSEHKGTATAETVLRLARGAVGEDEGLYRAEFVQLIEQWVRISRSVAEQR